MQRDMQFKRQNIIPRGRLKIFFSYGAGAGKTDAMLKAACEAKQRGVDVVAGFVDARNEMQNETMLGLLEQLPAVSFQHGSQVCREFPLDAAIRRSPQLILVDDLAHRNVGDCRHSQRYQDVEELLQAGIDVYATANVQNIESLNDTVTSITGRQVKERIPDSVFDAADQVELVDTEPRELMERLLSRRKTMEMSSCADMVFLSMEQLTALRELALRRCADRVNQFSENGRVKHPGGYHTDEHILVCLSSAPSNQKIIRTAARMAYAFHSDFTALFVETPSHGKSNAADRARLRDNMRLARQLGANIETVYGDDVPYQIAEFARLSGVSKIVIGRSTAARRFPFSNPTLTDKLISYVPSLDIHIIPDTEAANLPYPHGKNSKVPIRGEDVLKSAASLAGATMIGSIFQNLGFTEANIIMIYILSVLITAVMTSHQAYSMVSSVFSVVIFNFLFTEPRFTLLAYDKGYPVTFLVMLLAAFITGSLAVRLKNHARQSARNAYRTKLLFDMNRLLQQAREEREIAALTANQLVKLLGRTVIMYLARQQGLEEPELYAAKGQDVSMEWISEKEKNVAFWVWKNNKHAGATTDTFSDAKCLYLAIRAGNNVYGVVGIHIDDGILDAFENSILLSILGECALALENGRNAREKEQAAVLAQNEQLRANLLRAISHDLRTPLTSISGNASNLVSNGDRFDEETRKRLCLDIYDDSMWLINLVENLLAVTRIEEGRINMKMSAELMSEVIEEAMRHINRHSVEYQIQIDSTDELLMARMDARLMVQAIINIVDNAIKYTLPGSEIRIHTDRHGEQVAVTIADNGPGISDEAKSHVFDMFYTGANQIADSRRSLGLGLSLCKSIIQAHGGELSVSDNQPHGAVFRFTLPAEEVKVNE